MTEVGLEEIRRIEEEEDFSEGQLPESEGQKKGQTTRREGA